MATRKRKKQRQQDRPGQFPRAIDPTPQEIAEQSAEIRRENEAKRLATARGQSETRLIDGSPSGYTKQTNNLWIHTGDSISFGSYNE